MIKGRIIIADIEKISCNKEWILSQIAQRYVEKYQKHKRETDKKQELIAGYLLKEYLGVENDAQLVMNKNGKPMLVDARKHFNLSHSGKYVVLAIADQEVGIDIERLNVVSWLSKCKSSSSTTQLLWYSVIRKPTWFPTNPLLTQKSCLAITTG